jgi:hypothetical protein
LTNIVKISDLPLEVLEIIGPENLKNLSPFPLSEAVQSLNSLYRECNLECFKGCKRNGESIMRLCISFT